MDQSRSFKPGLALEAVGASRRGVSHDRNEDAFFIDVTAGLFCVADGLGGHRDGNVASNAVVSILERTLDPDASFEEKIETATRAIHHLNAALYRESAAATEIDISCSTLALLIIGDAYACCLWAGDSRIYLSRGSDLYLISEDHAAPGGTLTRAVGAADHLIIDRRLIAIGRGDIFLLCSDGLTKGAGEDELAAMIDSADEALADRLVAKAVAGGSKDDITLVLVRVPSHDD